VRLGLSPGQAAGEQITLATSLERGYAGVKLNLTEEIAKMPEADSSFKLGSTSEPRNFGRLFGHVANAQFGSRAAALGHQPSPASVSMRAKGLVPPSTD
jgi:hypothetical protein